MWNDTYSNSFTSYIHTNISCLLQIEHEREGHVTIPIHNLTIVIWGMKHTVPLPLAYVSHELHFSLSHGLPIPFGSLWSAVLQRCPDHVPWNLTWAAWIIYHKHMSLPPIKIHFSESNTHTHVHFKDPTFTCQKMNMKHVRHWRLLNAGCLKKHLK